jgi:ABC-type xylose transport system permease subunit
MHSVLVYDEGRAGLDSARAMENINKAMQDFFQECGQYGHVIIIVLLVVLLITGSLINPAFLTAFNFSLMLPNIGEILLIAMPMTLLIIAGEIDLSVASIVGLSGVIFGLTYQNGLNIWLAAFLGVIVGVLCGAVNGILVARIGLGSLAVTIATLALYRGFATAAMGMLLNRVLGIQYLDPWRACTLFLLLRRLSSEETMSTRLTHDLGCNWTDEFPRRLL